MPYCPFRAYRGEMIPDWLDYDRLQVLLASLAVLAVVLALVFLALARGPALKVFSVVLFGALALGATWQLQTINDARRIDCSQVEVFGELVVVPACAATQT